jgi:membrane glycosyltransferase
MSERSLCDELAMPAALPVWRPVLFFFLVGLTIAGFLWLGIVALSPRGFGAIDLILIILFAVTLPWFVIGFWNATIGFLIMRFAHDPVAAVTPIAGRVQGDEPITASTAILLCIRNEQPEQVVRLLEPMLEGIAAAQLGGQFHVYVLSDTSDRDIALTEELRFAALGETWRDRVPLRYRRRTSNIGYKGGNIREFCERWGELHDFAVMLDADSAMGVDLLLKLVRTMQMDPGIGILQTLVIGMPSASPFARIFQFGMRLSMRSYTIGSAWWQGDCGPYWGHNAIVRLAPFIACCQLPVLDRGALVKGHVLSHDQIEAALMRKAGYEVRVLAEEGASFEQNPPTLLEFIRRDLRWCQGNMQYWHFLPAPGLRAISRYQLALAILMFVDSPAWIGLLFLGAVATAMAPTPADFLRPDAGIALLLLVLATWFAPNIATVIDVLARRDLRHLFGGAIRFSASFAITVVFVLLLTPIMWASHTIFLARLLLGRTMGWLAQARNDHTVPWSLAARHLWRQTLLGLAPVLLLAIFAPSALPYALFITAGPLLAIPLAVATASPALGRALIATGIDRLPEETAPPPELERLKLPAIEVARQSSSRGDEARHLRFSVGAGQGLRTLPGIVRSLRLYYGDRERRDAMHRLYGRFVRPGDLVFDIGAHVGDRVAAFRRLGARVVAVEPQPALAKMLRLLFCFDRAVTIEPVAAGARTGTSKLMLNTNNLTVATASGRFVQAANGVPGWSQEKWTRTIVVPLTTLDALIARHGMPAFVKIDVEGLEADVLAGVTRPVPALSFEFTTIQPDVALACISRCAELGYDRFNAIIGEHHALIHPRWLSAEDIAGWLADLPMAANSGDIYAVQASVISIQ